MSPEIHDLQVGPKSFRTFPDFSLILDPQRYLLTDKSSGRFFIFDLKLLKISSYCNINWNWLSPKSLYGAPPVCHFRSLPGGFSIYPLTHPHCLSSIPWCTTVEALVAWMDWSFGWRCISFNILCWHCLTAHTFLQTQSPVPPCISLPSSLS